MVNVIICLNFNEVALGVIGAGLSVVSKEGYYSIKQLNPEANETKLKEEELNVLERKIEKLRMNYLLSQIEEIEKHIKEIKINN